MRVAFRVAIEQDAPAIVPLVNEAYRVEDTITHGNRTDLADVADHFARGSFIVAESENGAMAGCVFVSVNADAGYFGMLAVHPEWQGTGLGRTLVERAEAFCRERGATTMGLTVINLRESLIGWYERLGYEPVAAEPFPVPEVLKVPAHFVVMQKPIAVSAAPTKEAIP